MRSALSAVVVCCMLGACGADPPATVPGDVPTVEPVAEPVLESSPEEDYVPRWTAALAGSDRDPTGHYFTNMAAADAAGRVVLWRDRGHGYSRLIPLSLLDVEEQGTVRYFEALRRRHRITPADMIMIAIALQRAFALGTPDVHSTSHPALTFRDDVLSGEEPPALHDPPPYPAPPDPDTQEPAPPVESIPPLLSPLRPSPPRPVFSPPAPYNPHPWCPWGPPAFVPAPAAPDVPSYSIPPPGISDAQRGIERYFWSHAHASPWDEGYKPAPGEEMTFFPYDGVLYHGYMMACPDYQPHPALLRWEVKTGEYLRVKLASGQQQWKMDPWIKHVFWDDGKNPACKQDAEEHGRHLCGGGGAAMILACGSVPWCWAAFATRYGASGSFFLGTALYEQCKAWVNTYAAEHICDR